VPIRRVPRADSSATRSRKRNSKPVRRNNGKRKKKGKKEVYTSSIQSVHQNHPNRAAGKQRLRRRRRHQSTPDGHRHRDGPLQTPLLPAPGTLAVGSRGAPPSVRLSRRNPLQLSVSGSLVLLLAPRTAAPSLERRRCPEAPCCSAWRG
jgi:hypothetical protein